MKMVELKIRFGTAAAILLVCTAITVVSQPEVGDEPRHQVTLDLSADSYQEFFSTLRFEVQRGCIRMHEDHGVLPADTGDPKTTKPPWWIIVSLYDGDERKSDLFFRSNSLYLIAFADKEGSVYYMEGNDKLFEGLTDANPLPFTEKYGHLTEKAEDQQSSEIMKEVDLGQQAARMAANDLSNFGSGQTSISLVKRALLTFTIMIAESLRFKQIGIRCIEHWLVGSRLTQLEANRTRVWSRLSKLLLTKNIDDRVTKYENRMRQFYGVTMIRDIDQILDFVLNFKNQEETKAPDNLVGCAFGANFKPHIIHVAAAQDVNTKIISFSQQGPRAICILSASGVISNVKLRHPDSLGGTVTYKGRFELLSLSGSFTPTHIGGTRNHSGGMNVTLAAAHGRVIRGGVAGLLVAAAPVQVVVGRFFPSYHQLDQNWTAKLPVPGG